MADSGMKLHDREFGANRWRRCFGLALVSALVIPSVVAARPGAQPRSAGPAVLLPLETFEPLRLEAVDREQLLRRDAERKTPGPLSVAEPRLVSIRPEIEGIWESLDDGGQLWRYRVEVPGATDLNFGFSKYHMPEGATLHVISERGDYFEGPFSAKDNKPHGELWTPVVPGSRAVLELFVPIDAGFPPELELTHVNAGYRDLFKLGPQPKQGSCNIDVVCSEANAWRDQVRSVARYMIRGVGLCTGTLLADVSGSRRNFFLTAFHCGANVSNAPSVVVYWNYESANCGDLSGGSLADNQTGATFRAARREPDMALIELDDRPSSASNVYYAGWDRTGNAPGSSVGIHHPSADEKAISFNDDPVVAARNCIIGDINTVDSHWDVDNWEEGTTEQGSSGSALFHGASKRVIGMLSGGVASCSNPGGFDCYGRFSSSWDGPSSTQRLRDWLDPAGNGPQRLNGFDPSGGGTCDVDLGTGRYCTECGPCGDGQGDCDSNAECAAGLTCVDNVGAQFGFAPGIDVCLSGSTPPPPPGCGDVGTGRYCTDCGPCGEGQGDCDSNAECAAGLTCVDNVGAQFGFAPGIDVCLSGSTPPPPPGCGDVGTGRYCTDCGPCGDGQGDCDSDAECVAGLTCEDNVGAMFGFAPGVDVCVGTAGCNETLGNGRYCTACGPCGQGQGDCDSDTECAAGLTCVDNVGAQFGFAPGVDVCL